MPSVNRQVSGKLTILTGYSARGNHIRCPEIVRKNLPKVTTKLEVTASRKTGFVEASASRILRDAEDTVRVILGQWGVDRPPVLFQ